MLSNSSDPDPVVSQPAVGTFLFTDIEGSTRLVRALGDRYPELLERQRQLISTAVEGAGGRVFGSEGDALFAVFAAAGAAISAAADAQRGLAGERWPDDGLVRVRMGIHSGEALLAGGDYVGLPLHQVARITSAGHGGQVLVSEAARQLAGQLPGELDLRDLGERRLKDLAAPERLYQLVGDGLDDEFPPLRTLDARPNNLPVQLTSFVGRDELAAARAALDATRLLTLTGPGGTGKTRLSLQLAAEVADDYPDGLYFVALDALREAELVPSAIASTIGLNVTGATPPLDALAAELQDKAVLLVLDNFEQIVDGAPAVAQLLRAATGVKAIVTSRIVLHVYGEHEFPVPPLALAGAPGERLTAEQAARSEAVRLFVERAQAVQPGFALTDENAPLVDEITRRLDGLPLAIELAAARMRILPLESIRARLDERLSLLTGGARDVPGRQQTLRGAIDWSHELLDDGLRRLFARLSAFRGGAALEQIEAVCGPAGEIGREVFDGISELVDQSLVRRVEAGAEARFAMLETIREYGQDKLLAGGEAAEIELRHARAYLALAERYAPELHGPRQLELLDRLEMEQGNLRIALDGCSMVACAVSAPCTCAPDEHAGDDERVEISLRLVAALWRFWQKRDHLLEGRNRTERILALPRVKEHGESYLHALEAAGGISYWMGDVDATERLYRERLELARATGKTIEIANALYDLSFAYIIPSRETEKGVVMLHEALELYRAAADRAGMAKAQWAMATDLFNRRQWPAALELLEAVVAAFRELDNSYDLGWGLHSLGVAEIRVGKLGQARRDFTEGMRIFAAANDQSGIVLFLADFAELAAAEADEKRALRLYGASRALVEQTGAGLADVMRDENMPFATELVALLGKVGDERREALAAEGAALSQEDAIAYALEEPSSPPSSGSNLSAAELMQ
jgi:predicted ATPase/class 3 adenylate cyclase